MKLLTLKFVLFCVSLSVQSVYAQKSNPNHDEFKKKNQSNNSRLNIHHFDLGDVGEWGRPLSYEKMSLFSEYTDYIWKQKKGPKLVLIDGPFRGCSFLTSLKFAE